MGLLTWLFRTRRPTDHVSLNERERLANEQWLVAEGKRQLLEMRERLARLEEQFAKTMAARKGDGNAG